VTDQPPDPQPPDPSLVQSPDPVPLRGRGSLTPTRAVSPRSLKGNLGQMLNNLEATRIAASVALRTAMLHKRTLPAGFIEPCLPTKADTLPSGGLWVHEIKHDGFRPHEWRPGEAL
jgi:hypothetical protein